MNPWPPGGGDPLIGLAALCLVVGMLGLAIAPVWGWMLLGVGGALFVVGTTR